MSTFETDPSNTSKPDEPEEDDSQTGRLSVDDDALDGRGNDLYAVDEGAAGGLESAEEAATHVEDDA